ncbi:MAG TPA: isoprenyl transferase [Thermomicrobiales bacterium]|nr:isoprenyl transferase [Thermomicrobiales bacterium]
MTAHPPRSVSPTPAAHESSSTPIDPSRVPRHVAIIMDGNGRWARQRGLARLEGHEAGTENIRRITHAAGQVGIRYLTLWAFSAENWRRPREEVEGLLNILSRAIETETEELHRQGAQLRHIGDLRSLSPDLQGAIEGAIERTKYNDKLVLTLAFNYGGRQELTRAVQNIVASGVAPEDIDEDMIERYLYTHDLPDPDLIIRTSGEYRLSNFLCWQGAYSELHFSPTLWPDFSPGDLESAVRDYAQRERRFGAISNSSITG